MKLEFIKKVHASFDANIASLWVGGRLQETRRFFRKEMARGTGVSAPFTFPINKSGDLSGGTQIRMLGGVSGEIGSNVGYAKFLDKGTSKMKPRKMYKDALNRTMKRTPKLEQLASAVKFIQK